MKQTYLLNIVGISLLISGCSTALKVATQPEQASVFLIANETGEKRKLGVTPFELKNEELKEAFSGAGAPGDFVSIVVEKDEYQTRNLWLPLSSAGVIASNIELQLKKDDKKVVELKTAKEVLDKMFLAQRFARTNQFERALTEIDKVIESFPQLGRALSMKASILYAKGDFKDSLDWYEKALAADPELKDAVEMAALVRQRLRLPAGAAPKN